MKIFDLDILERNTDQDNLYDLSQVTYKMVGGINIYAHVVDIHEEMRIDNICNKIYESTEYIDFLLSFNDIDNPFNVKSGDVIYYVDINDIDTFRVTPEKQKTLQKTLLNSNKETRKDSSRQKYVEADYSLPPTLLDTPVESVQVKGDSILIGINGDSTN